MRLSTIEIVRIDRDWPNQKKTEADATRFARMIRRRARECGDEYLAGEGS